MTDILLFLAPAAVICLVLALSHCYLGMHIVSRGVIFVDLALAQVAALGATLVTLFGYEPHSPEATVAVNIGAIIFVLMGAGIFALGRFRDEAVPQEAIIGIVYAVSSAATILALSKDPHGGEAIRDMLIGQVLYVKWDSIALTTLIYLAVGVVHWIFRKRFLLISSDVAEARRRGWSIRFWDFLFYATFGLVVTRSVQIGGVLLVFSYLVVPAACAMLFSRSIGIRLAIGLAVGVVVSLAGLGLSAGLDLPTGAAIVATFGLAIAIAALAHYLFGRSKRGAAHDCPS